MGKLLKIMTAALAVCLLLPLTAAAAVYSPPFEPTAQAVYLYNLDSDMLVYEKNADMPLAPGDLAMMMTTILALEDAEARKVDMDNTLLSMSVGIQDMMYRERIARGGIALSGIYSGEELTLTDFLHAVMLRGGNEAAQVVADYVGDGSVEYFLRLMNTKAQELGAKNTFFNSAHGLYDGGKSYTTARDMFLITRYCLQNPSFVKLMNTTYYKTGATNKQESIAWGNSNSVILPTSPYYCAYVSGVKEANTNEEGNSLVSTAKKDGYNYLLVVLAAPSKDKNGNAYADNLAFTETKQLYDWAFDTFAVKTLLDKGKNFGEVPLKLTWGKDHVKLMSQARFQALIPNDIEPSSIQYDLHLPELVKAPISAGDEIGSVTLVLAGENIGEVTLVAAETVPVSRFLLLCDRVVTGLNNFWFKLCLALFVLLLILYIALMIVRNRNKRRYKQVKRKRSL